MSSLPRDPQLDDLLTEALGSEPPRLDFRQWLQEHLDAIAQPAGVGAVRSFTSRVRAWIMGNRYVSQRERIPVQAVDNAEIDRFHRERWSEIAQGAARTMVWNRRLQRINVALLAAILLMAVQVGWSALMLARLHGAAASVPQIVRLMLS